MSIKDETVKALEALDLPRSDAGVAAVLVRLAEAIDDIDEDGLNPAGKLDNVSVPTYLKFAESLGMTPNSRSRIAGGKPAAAVASKPGTVTSMRERRARRTG